MTVAKPASTLKVTYREVAMGDVIAYFVAGFTIPDGEKLIPYAKPEVFFDPMKKVFIFKLYTEPTKETS